MTWRLTEIKSYTSRIESYACFRNAGEGDGGGVGVCEGGAGGRPGKADNSTGNAGGTGRPAAGRCLGTPPFEPMPAKHACATNQNNTFLGRSLEDALSIGGIRQTLGSVT